MKRKIYQLLLLSSFFLISGISAYAQDTPVDSQESSESSQDESAILPLASDEWEFHLAPLYIWFAGIGGSSSIGPVTAPLDISFSDPRYWIRPARRVVRSLLAIIRLNFKLREYRHDREVEIMRKGYTKRPECNQCRFFLICDGLENGYVESIGLDELKPVPGPWLSDPFHFRKPYVN